MAYLESANRWKDVKRPDICQGPSLPAKKCRCNKRSPGEGVTEGLDFDGQPKEPRTSTGEIECASLLRLPAKPSAHATRWPGRAWQWLWTWLCGLGSRGWWWWVCESASGGVDEAFRSLAQRALTHPTRPPQNSAAAPLSCAATRNTARHGSKSEKRPRQGQVGRGRARRAAAGGGRRPTCASTAHGLKLKLNLQILADPFETRFSPFTLEHPRVRPISCS